MAGMFCILYDIAWGPMKFFGDLFDLSVLEEIWHPDTDWLWVV